MPLSRVAPTAIVVVGLSVLLLSAVRASAATAPVGLGTASSFVVLAGKGITNTGATTIGGDIGTFPTPAETGMASVTLTSGANHVGDSVTQQAKLDLVTAYDTAAGSGPPAAVPTELGGRTLQPGVYGGPTLGITGTLTLDTGGDPSAVFVFQASSTLITASESAVTVLNGGTACNVFWQIGSSATLGTGSHLIGSVLALTDITATTGATVDGRLLARNGAVTLDNNTITNQVCASGTTTTSALSGPTTTQPAPPTTVTPTTVTPTTLAATTTTQPVTPTTQPVTGTTVTPTTQAATTTTTKAATTKAVTSTTQRLNQALVTTTTRPLTTTTGAVTTTTRLLTTTTHGVTTTTGNSTTTIGFGTPSTGLAVTGSNLLLPLLGGLAVVFGTALLLLTFRRPSEK